MFPESVTRVLWDCDPGTLSWERHRDFLIERVLTDGSWDAIQWVRARVGDAAIRELILRTNGRRFSPRQLRLWQTILDLPEDLVIRWIRSEARQIWDRRGR